MDCASMFVDVVGPLVLSSAIAVPWPSAEAIMSLNHGNVDQEFKDRLP